MGLQNSENLHDLPDQDTALGALTFEAGVEQERIIRQLEELGELTIADVPPDIPIDKMYSSSYFFPDVDGTQRVQFNVPLITIKTRYPILTEQGNAEIDRENMQYISISRCRTEIRGQELDHIAASMESGLLVFEEYPPGSTLQSIAQLIDEVHTTIFSQ